ncbi:MAG: UvrD-helicase domain-containing protein [Desulfobaccales bacterium]
MSEPQDARERRLIAENLDCSMLVEAGAGSGKTSSLVDRMLALIGTGKAAVGRMAAVTFTRKAAAELKGRFQIALEDRLRQDQDEAARVKYSNALSKMELLFTGTIHSFCAMLLRERPIEAGLDPDFQELEEDENALYRDRCWAEYLERLHSEESGLLKNITDLGIDPADLLKTYQSVSYFPEVEVARVKMDRPDFSRGKVLVKGFLDRAFTQLPSRVPQKGWDKLQILLRRVSRLLDFLELGDDLHFVQILQVLSKNAKITQYKWPDKEQAKALEHDFDEIRGDVVIPYLEHWQRYCHFFIMEFIIPAVAYFQEFREKKSLMNFQDLLLKAAALLRESPEVRSYFQERFTHILVDEFQDTDPIQAELILYLTGEDLTEKSWRRLKVKPGALFVVGDPKQSIFRFRRADIDTYNDVKEIIDRSDGQIISLTTNFRSVPALCTWLNPIFRAKFPEKASQFQPGFEELVPFQQEAIGGVRRITLEDFSKQEEAAQEDAALIAAWVYEALTKDRGGSPRRGDGEAGIKLSSPGDVMVLLRYKAHLAIYARALEAFGIPFQVTGSSGFRDSGELRQLLNLLTAVAAPDDQVALIATLRGQFFGVSDDLLYRFRAAGGRFSYLESIDQCQDEEPRERLGAALTELRQFYQWAERKPPAAALSLILDRLGIIPLALIRQMGESRAGNLLKALELALWEASENLTSFADLVARLSEYYAEIEVEEMSVEPGKVDAVRLMNLHKAKGLQAEMIFLADPLKAPDHRPSLHISRTEHISMGYFVAIREKGFQRDILGLPPEWPEKESLEVQYQQAEEERLLYVATTRAKQLLVVSTCPQKPNRGPWKDLYQYLGGVPELPAPRQRAVESIPEGKISPQALETARSDRAARISWGKQPSYAVESVTAAAKASTQESPFTEDSDKGMSWGRIVHRLLEAAARDSTLNLDLSAQNLLVEEERPLTERDEVVALVKSVMCSELWRRQARAEKRLFEVPFSLTLQEEIPKVMSGVIDLAFKEPDGWVIADYKTDRVNKNLDALIAFYRRQVEMYKDFWERMSGEKVKEAGLYFINIGRWIEI